MRHNYLIPRRFSLDYMGSPNLRGLRLGHSGTVSSLISDSGLDWDLEVSVSEREREIACLLNSMINIITL